MPGCLFFFHPFDDFQSCEFFTFLFFQRICDRVDQRGVHWDRDVLQRVGALLGFLDVAGQTVGCVFHHGELDRQVLHLPECLPGPVDGLMGGAESVGRLPGVRHVLDVGDLCPHDTARLDADGIFNGHGKCQFLHPADAEQIRQILLGQLKRDRLLEFFSVGGTAGGKEVEQIAKLHA